VAGIVLQLHRVAGAGYEPDHRTTDGESWLRANDCDVDHVAVNRASAVGDGAGLHRRIGLVENRSGVSRAAKKRGRKGKVNVTRAEDNEIVAGIVLQRESFTE